MPSHTDLLHYARVAASQQPGETRQGNRRRPEWGAELGSTNEASNISPPCSMKVSLPIFLLNTGLRS